MSPFVQNLLLSVLKSAGEHPSIPGSTELTSYERNQFLMSIYTGHGMRLSVRYLVIFLKYKIPKLSPVVGSFLIVSSFRKMESATFKKGQKTETGIAEAEETEALLQSQHSQSGPLLKMFWSMFGTYFLLSTVCLVICDVFLFSTPKLLRYVHIYNVFLSHVQDCRVHELRVVYVSTHRHTNTDLSKSSLADGRSSGVICAEPSVKSGGKATV